MIRLVLLSLTVASATATAVVCLPNTCNSVTCSVTTAEDCSEATFVHNASFCGCCALCITYLAKGEDCQPSEFLRVPAPEERWCGDGLVCDTENAICISSSSKREVTKCQKDVEKADSPDKSVPRYQFDPRCDSDGNYEARQCHNSVCFCVDEQGIRIGHYRARNDDSDKMNCMCARDENNYKISGKKAKQFFCTELGNYPN